MTAPQRAESRRVVDVDPSTDPRWAELVQTHRSDVFHSPAWAATLRECYGFDVRAAVVVADERPVAGMAYVDLDDVRGRRRVSLPFSDFCDPLVTDPPDWDLLSAQMTAGDLPVTIRCLRHPIGVDSGPWSETGTLGWHRVDASRPPDEAWDKIHSSARRAVRKATSSGVEVRAAESEGDLRAFFEMHLGVRKHKYGLLAQPYRFFTAIWERFLAVGDGRLLLASVDDDVVGGVLYLRWKDTLYYKFNASRPNELGVRPNDLLVWEGLAHAHAEGLSWFDFGVSDWDQEGLVRYKRKYATEEGVVRRLSAGRGPADRVGPLLGQVTGLLVEPSVPDAVTEAAGDLLYPYFS